MLSLGISHLIVSGQTYTLIISAGPHQTWSWGVGGGNRHILQHVYEGRPCTGPGQSKLNSSSFNAFAQGRSGPSHGTAQISSDALAKVQAHHMVQLIFRLTPLHKVGPITWYSPAYERRQWTKSRPSDIIWYSSSFEGRSCTRTVPTNARIK